MLIGPWSHDEFMDEARKFHGYPAPGLIIGGYMVTMARAALPQGILFDAISETVQCLPDAVQLLTPCTVGNGWLRIVNFGIYAVSLFDKRSGEGFRVRLDVSKLGPWPEIRAWFLKEKAKSEQNTHDLQDQIRDAGTQILSMSPIVVRPDVLIHKGKGRVVPCPLCGDWYPASFGGICRSCQGESPYTEGPGLSFTAEPALSALPVAEAVGKHALHDMTRIIPEQEKGPAFTAGQEFTAGDVCRLQHMGRNRVYVLEDAVHGECCEDWVHENTAVTAFAEAMPGTCVRAEGAPREGKINFSATVDGLLSVDVARLERFNLVPHVMCTTRHHMSVIHTGTRIAGTRAIPLYLSRTDFIKAMAVLEEGPLFKVMPMRRAQVGILVTGTEVFQGLIQDKFEPIITQKAQSLHCQVVASRIAPDDATHISRCVAELMDAGADLIITTAGLSVDPDDVTRKALMDAGLTDVLYGIPVLPGTMTLMGRIGTVQVLGVPACALFYKTTGLDLILPRLLANAPITRLELARLGNGGLCMECKSCVFPKCPFGR
ncbi:MAG: FmdE family protein [Desulfovibrionaceae bacterium]